MNADTLREYLHPPQSPRDCVFAQVMETVSADLKTRITPCQFGGDPDCSQCGRIASMALARVGHKKAFDGMPPGAVLERVDPRRSHGQVAARAWRGAVEKQQSPDELVQLRA